MTDNGIHFVPSKTTACSRQLQLTIIVPSLWQPDCQQLIVMYRRNLDLLGYDHDMDCLCCFIICWFTRPSSILYIEQTNTILRLE